MTSADAPLGDDVPDVTEAEFDRLLGEPLPVLAEFHARWCAPCRAMAPLVARLAARVSGRARVVAVDVDEAPGAMLGQAVRGVPAFLVFVGGREVARLYGPASMGELDALLAPFVGAE